MTHPEGVATRATRGRKKTSWHRLLAQVVTEPLTSAKISVQTEIDVTSASPKADMMKNGEPMGLTPEYVMDLGRRELFASMLNTMSDEELLKLQRPANIFREGKQEGRQEGEQKGRQEGEAKILLRLLQRRFGELPSWAIEKVSTAKPVMLEEWSLRILDAPTLESVLADPS
ncbi:MAG: DUF4351 domain-containing protein [Magnetococcales bacterium]|nr:DUF4351 domain-containing protein [Magnetococcales bacterium]